MPGRVDTRSYFERDPKTGTYSGGITSKYNFMNMVDCKWETKSELCTIVKDTRWAGEVVHSFQLVPSCAYEQTDAR